MYQCKYLDLLIYVRICIDQLTPSENECDNNNFDLCELTHPVRRSSLRFESHFQPSISSNVIVEGSRCPADGR